jgi:dihydroneopterin aldolase
MTNTSQEWALMTECRKLFLEGFEVQARIGIHDFELKSPQRLIIDIELYVPLALSTPSKDAIHEVVDYDFIREVVFERIERGHINLQESLVDDLVNTLLANPSVKAARVSSYKPDVYPDCAAVGVEVFRSK